MAVPARKIYGATPAAPWQNPYTKGSSPRYPARIKTFPTPLPEVPLKNTPTRTFARKPAPAADLTYVSLPLKLLRVCLKSKLVRVPACVIILSISLTMVACGYFNTESSKLAFTASDLQTQMVNYETEIDNINTQLAKKETPSYLIGKAQKLKMEPAKNLGYINLKQKKVFEGLPKSVLNNPQS
jgi:hypothetical protein